ncbi:PTS galactitol transporter subunit IIA [Tyzzerella sp. An114]|uniref:PTS sugar transporter subunit IIA n=1 Tax=Tyzzerella sp. An114 TaxID=1965545 RepID=UPI000B443FF8|nr:PTS sugar transporter subunit IIA [Tyzzerella sp. An114]OUQ55944.1 PTS galactitol transporter subunit IIA [Tyzzerella sp. An114]
MSAIRFDKSLIKYFSGEMTNTEVLSQMCEHLQSMGIVKDTYKEAILKREKIYPTGLDCKGINIAIPHADIQNVNEAAICVGVLKSPVLFNIMDEPDNTVEINLVIMLALTEAHGHIDILNKIVNLIQNQDELRAILKSENVEDIENLIKSRILN